MLNVFSGDYTSLQGSKICKTIAYTRGLKYVTTVALPSGEYLFCHTTYFVGEGCGGD